MKCLKCNTGTLQAVNIEGVEVDKCNNCSGIWFDIGELSAILNKMDISVLKNKVDNNTGHDELDAECPRCEEGTKLMRIESDANPDIHIDICLKCYGQWLDGGELEAIRKNHKSIFDRMKKYLDE